ncbi:MAG: DUF3486 family protein [Methyloprofundus sp.]|nr:DUF3486 family protein [Methyloprofundus sp.]
MGKKSTLDLLPPEVKVRLDALLGDPSYTQAQVAHWMNDYLQQIAQPPVMTERIVNRYAVSMKEMLAKKRESQEVVKTWVNQMGSIPDGDFGRAIVEILRTLSFDMSLAAHKEMGKGDIEDLPGSVRMLKDLSFAVEKLEKAASENEKRDAIVRKQAREEAAVELTEGLKNEGISVEVENSIRRILLGK